MTDHIQLPVVLDSASRRKDRSLSLRFSTTLEISNQDFAAIDLVTGNIGYLLFSPNQFTESDIPQDDAPNDLKTPSQRIQSVLFLLWKQDGEPGDFRSYYLRRCERIIEFLKGQIKEPSKD